MMRIPTLFSRHAATRELLRYVDGDVSIAPALRGHLASCTRCRATLQELRALQGTANALRGPSLGRTCSHTSSRVSQRGRPCCCRSPRSRPPPRPRWGWGATGSAASGWWASRAAALVIASWFAGPNSDLLAGDLSGDLRFAPARPHAGDSVAVTFRAPATLVGERRLVLRGRFRTAWDAAYNHGTHQQAVAMLQRGRGGLYHGGFRLPAGVTFATFAVEDTAARQVDSQGGGSGSCWPRIRRGARCRTPFGSASTTSWGAT
jgi:hypothetical protein